MVVMSLFALMAAFGAATLAALGLVFFCLIFSVVMGVILLVVAARLKKSPEFYARHRALRMVCKVAGIVGVVLGAGGAVLYVTAVVSVTLRLAGQ